jgi:ABC transporter with metal-binding/Fe-S-binding domain ATP-binding protein
MKLGILFTGGKDSTYATFLAKQYGNDISCLITLKSKNPESYMFHTPSISMVKKQAEVMGISLITKETKGLKERELIDLKIAIENSKKKFGIEGIVTGAVESVYQVSRIQKICDDLDLECFNPLWQKDQFELLNDLLFENFKIIITGVFAYPLDKSWIGRKIDHNFIRDIKKYQLDYQINPAGEGGEFETFVFDCPLFKRSLKILEKSIEGKNNAWRMEIEVE